MIWGRPTGAVCGPLEGVQELRECWGCSRDFFEGGGSLRKILIATVGVNFVERFPCFGP